jgi:Protein of unknown function (DUF3141)
MSDRFVDPKPQKPAGWLSPAHFVIEHWVDAWQRSILLLDALRRRGNNYFEHNSHTAPNVLSFAAELVLDGRTLLRPVNYGLVRIITPDGTTIDPRSARSSSSTRVPGTAPALAA